jgi:hypothetical protein
MDDFILHLRHGKRYGFEFEKHLMSPMAVLRRYVKDTKKAERMVGIKRIKY